MRYLLVLCSLASCSSSKPVQAPAPTMVDAGQSVEESKAEESAEQQRSKKEIADRAIEKANEGVDAANQGKFPEAIARFKEATALNPADHKTWNMMGLLHTHLRQKEEAIAAFGEAAKLEPNNSEYHYLLGTAHWRAGGQSVEDRSRALAPLQRALALDPKNHKAHHLIGRVFKSRGEAKAAAQSWTKSIQLKPDNAKSFSHLAELYIQWRRFDDALLVLNQARSRVSEPGLLSRVLYDLGLVLAKQRKWGESVWAYSLLISAHPEDVEALAQRALSFAKAGDVVQAKRDLLVFVKADTGDPKLVRSAKARLAEANYLRKKPRRNKSLEPKPLADASRPLQLPAVPEFKIPKMVGDAHMVEEMLLRHSPHLDTTIKIRGFIVWIYDCANDIRAPGMSKKTLKRLLATEPERCTRPHFYLGETSKLDKTRVVEVVEVPRKLRPDEIKIYSKEQIDQMPPVPKLKLGQEVVVSGRWALISPKGFQSSEGLLVYEAIEPAP